MTHLSLNYALKFIAFLVNAIHGLNDALNIIAFKLMTNSVWIMHLTLFRLKSMLDLV